MDGILGLLLAIGFVVYFTMADKILDRKVDNYNTRNVDFQKMAIDKSRNNLSDKQVQRNMVNGKYDKK